MIKRALFIAPLLFSSPILANEDFDSESKLLAGPCVHLRTPERCVNYPTGECFWDYADQRCENRRPDEDICSSIRSYQRCINTFSCFWDHDDQRCERRD